MKTSSLFLSSLVAAAAMSSIPAFAEEITLSNGTKTELPGSSGTVGSGNTYSYATPSGTDKGGWLWLGVLGATGNVAFGTSESQMALSGTGIIAVGYQGGNGGVAYNFDFSNTDASAFSGKFAVVNEWDNDTVVKLSGEGWSNVEYVSGGVSREQSWATLRSYANSGRAMDKLELQGATTLAGITGVSKGYSYGSVSDVNSKEFVTASSTGTVLTLAGTGTYSYYGSVGTSSVSIGLEKTGTGTQTFGGAVKYLSSVNVSAGALALTDGAVTISGDATVASGASLDLSGATVTLSKAISNSGTVTVDSSSVFVLADALKTADNTYTLISGGTITNWDSETLSRVNFRLGTSELTARSTVDVSSSGVVVINNVATKALTWGGAATGTWDTSTTNKPWTDGTSADAFYAGDSVTFSTANANVTVSGTVAPAAMTVSQATTLSGTGTVSVAAANLTASATLTLGDNVTLDLGSSKDAVSNKNISGTGTVKFTSTATGHGGKLTLGSGFTGTIDYTGKFNTSNGTDNSGAKFRLSNGTMWGSNTISNEIHFLTNYQIGDSSATTIVLNGKITTESGTTLTIGGTNPNATFGGNATIGSLEVGSNGVLNITGSSTVSGTFSGAGTLNVNDGATLEMVGNSSSTNQVKSAINVKGGGTLKFSGHDLTGWSTSTDTVAVLTGDSTEKLARLDINDTDTLTFTHVVAMNGNALISTSRDGGSKFNTLGGKITATGTNNTISDVVIQIRNGFEVAVSGKDDELKITSAIVNHGEGSGGLTKTGLGTLILSNENSTLSRAITISAGTLVAGSAKALGTGKTTVAADAKLGLVAKVTVAGVTGGITLTEGAKIVIDMTDVDASSAETFVLDLITGTSLTYGETSITSENVDSTLKNVIEFSNWGEESLDDWTQKLAFNESSKTLSLSLTKIPEPSAFGLLAGVGALVFVAARRRRRAK